ncbi:uncharacterized protein LOC141899293 [Tubulanus polymorphus]|uniref:uncharacterized protein LOC141899293 n=1 Tax=Tubulanus polymorphus TaxID=672921 RepID=UPI003DA5855C
MRGLFEYLSIFVLLNIHECFGDIAWRCDFEKPGECGLTHNKYCAARHVKELNYYIKTGDVGPRGFDHIMECVVEVPIDLTMDPKKSESASSVKLRKGNKCLQFWYAKFGPSMTYTLTFTTNYSSESPAKNWKFVIATPSDNYDGMWLKMTKEFTIPDDTNLAALKFKLRPSVRGVSYTILLDDLEISDSCNDIDEETHGSINSLIRDNTFGAIIGAVVGVMILISAIFIVNHFYRLKPTEAGALESLRRVNEDVNSRRGSSKRRSYRRILGFKAALPQYHAANTINSQYKSQFSSSRKLYHDFGPEDV